MGHQRRVCVICVMHLQGGIVAGVTWPGQPPRVSCGLGDKVQCNVCDTHVTHVQRGVAPGVVTQSSPAWAKAFEFKQSAM